MRKKSHCRWNDLHSCSAKYGNFSMINSSNNKIVAFKVVHVGIGRRFKSNWEKRHNQQSRSKFKRVTNDCHTQKQSYLKKKWETKYFLVIWYVEKTKKCAELRCWKKSIINDFIVVLCHLQWQWDIFKRFHLTIHDLYFKIPAEIFTNHILA